MMTRIRKAGVLCLAAGLTMFWISCSGERGERGNMQCVEGPTNVGEASVSRDGITCAQDSDCRSGFCDRGNCVDLFGLGNYGGVCEPAPALAKNNPDLGPPETRCGGYLCVDGRCRSCQTNAECQQWLGSPACAVSRHWPGAKCEGDFTRRAPAGLPDTPATPPPSSPPPPPPP